MPDPSPTEFPLEREDITLGNLLKVHFSLSGGDAKHRIQDGKVQVDGAPCLARGKRLRGGELVALEGHPPVRVRRRPAP